MAAVVTVFGTLTSKGRAFSDATRVRRTRTASDTDRPIAARVLEARSLTRRSMRTWTISVAAALLFMRYIVSHDCRVVNCTGIQACDLKSGFVASRRLP